MIARVIIGGDVYPSHTNLPYFLNGNSHEIFHDLFEEFCDADLSIINLECPLTDQSTQILKYGPILRAPKECIKAFKNANINVINLANNHILDHGDNGLESTLRTISSANIDTVGAGRNLSKARRIFIKNIKGINLGILGIAETEFSIATENSYGANPLDLIDVVRNIASHREYFEHLIILFHGGNEGYPYPSPRLQNTCRFLIEQGALAVICQHSHCAGCYEKYRDGYIVYGQGNLIFDYPPARNDRNWTEGFLVRLKINKKKCEMDFIPFIQSRNNIGARKMQDTTANYFLQQIEKRSENILKERFVQMKWKQFCAERRNYYLSTVLGHNRVLRRLNRNGKLVKLMYSSTAMLGVENFVRCESHREVLETILDL